MKKKVVTIMTAASFQDWKSLASREGGDDAYVDGDLLRATGNVAGTTVDYVLKNAGQGIGSGVSTVASTIGNKIEAATSAIGARGLGAGVNSVMTGVGDGVGDTISGGKLHLRCTVLLLSCHYIINPVLVLLTRTTVGSGAGQVLKSVGQGAGQAFGGSKCNPFFLIILKKLTHYFTVFNAVAGGVLIVGKGLGKGITQGDGRAVATGLIQGGAAVGTGVGQGIESVVTGTAQGVLNVGQGLFSGAKNVGKGFGGAFLGKKKPNK
jgi:vacuolar protein sorting-associated protein 13A/C